MALPLVRFFLVLLELAFILYWVVVFGAGLVALWQQFWVYNNDFLADLELRPMGDNALVAETVLPIAKWVLMYDGTPKEVKILYGRAA